MWCENICYFSSKCVFVDRDVRNYECKGADRSKDGVENVGGGLSMAVKTKKKKKRGRKGVFL